MRKCSSEYSKICGGSDIKHNLDLHHYLDHSNITSLYKEFLLLSFTLGVYQHFIDADLY